MNVDVREGKQKGVRVDKGKGRRGSLYMRGDALNTHEQNRPAVMCPQVIRGACALHLRPRVGSIPKPHPDHHAHARTCIVPSSQYSITRCVFQLNPLLPLLWAPAAAMDKKPPAAPSPSPLLL